MDGFFGYSSLQQYLGQTNKARLVEKGILSIIYTFTILSNIYIFARVIHLCAHVMRPWINLYPSAEEDEKRRKRDPSRMQSFVYKSTKYLFYTRYASMHNFFFQIISNCRKESRRESGDERSDSMQSFVYKSIRYLEYTAPNCTTLQHTATYCNTLQHTATHCDTLQHTATHCNMQKRNATTPKTVASSIVVVCKFVR